MASLTLSELQQTLVGSLQSSALGLDTAGLSDFSDAAARAVAGALDSNEAAEPSLRRLDPDLTDRNRVYAVPDDALNRFPSLVLAALGAFTKGPTGALADLVGLMFRYRTLRVAITADEAAVLRALRDAKVAGLPPLTLAELRTRLIAAQTLPQPPLEDLLASLQAKKTDKATLVREVGGCWAIGNV